MPILAQGASALMFGIPGWQGTDVQSRLPAHELPHGGRSDQLSKAAINNCKMHAAWPYLDRSYPLHLAWEGRQRPHGLRAKLDPEPSLPGKCCYLEATTRLGASGVGSGTMLNSTSSPTCSSPASAPDTCGRQTHKSICMHWQVGHMQPSLA